VVTGPAQPGELGMVWAQAQGGVIGRDGGMPWHLPEDLAHFRAVTMGGPIIMGRRTWESLPARFRPLPGRHNIVISRSMDFEAPGASVVDSAAAAVELARDAGDAPVWVIGGGRVYADLIDAADVLEVTEIDLAVDGDTVAPAIDAGWRVDAVDGWHTSASLDASGAPLRYRFLRYRRAGQA